MVTTELAMQLDRIMVGQTIVDNFMPDCEFVPCHDSTQHDFVFPVTGIGSPSELFAAYHDPAGPFSPPAPLACQNNAVKNVSWERGAIFVDYFDFNESSDYRTSDTLATDEAVSVRGHSQAS